MKRQLQKYRPYFMWLLLLCFAGPMTFKATAEAAPKKKSSSKTKRKKRPAKDATIEAASVEKPKSFEVLVNAGMAPQPFIGFGGTAGMFLGDGSSAIETTLLMASGKIDPISVSQIVIGARYRKNIGSIPYVAAGLGLRSLAGKWYTLDTTGTDQFESGASSSSVVLDIAAGGQLRFGSIVLGADAVGIMYPIFKLSNKETLPEGTYDEEDYKTQKAKFDKQNGMGLVLFKVGVGFVF